MRKIYCIGETVLDIIFSDNTPIAARPGGSMLNTAVSLGRAGLDPVFISDYGKDCAGEIIHTFLVQNQVNVQFVDRFTKGKTAISLAFLDKQGTADYSFYREFPVRRFCRSLPDPSEGDIVVFGSNVAMLPDVRVPVVNFISQARKKGAFLIYDPNFRSPHLPQLPEFFPRIMENIRLAAITRGSQEDFLHIFNVSDGAMAFREITNHGGNTLIYTKSGSGVELWREDLHLFVPVPALQPVSTIGAGDGFNAGLIYGLLDLSPAVRMPVSRQEWERVIGRAIDFSTDICLGLDHYISPEFAQTLHHA